jgi:hypothetical protein
VGILRTFLVLMVILHLAWPASAQETTYSGPKRQMATIIYAGLGGAVLGLSTLSFYGRPQDHLSNIAIGFGLGVITGTVVMTYRAATNPKDFYGENLVPEGEKILWNIAQKSDQLPVKPVSWSYSF